MAESENPAQVSRRRVLLTTGGVVAAGVAGAASAGLIGAATAAAQTTTDYVGLVDPWIEADRGRFFFFQSASNPFGLVKLRPDTSTNTLWGTGYKKNETNIKGFSHLHCWQISGVQVMPTTGAGKTKLSGDSGWQSTVVHDSTEVAQPGYHKVVLGSYGVTAELTCTDRVGMHKYTYANAGRSEIIINLGGTLGEAAMKNASVTRVSSTEIEGFVVQGGLLTDGLYWPETPDEKTTLFFSIKFDKAFDSMRGWKAGALVDSGAAVTAVAGDNMGVYVVYDSLAAGAVVQMKVGLSFTGLAGARANLAAELSGWDFAAVKTASQNKWNAMLGRVAVEGGTAAQQKKFYTDMFHALCGRSVVSDVDGKYLDNTWRNNTVKQIPLDTAGKPTYAMYNYDAIWLTHTNLNTLFGLAYPEIYSSFVKSQLRMYQDGGMLPRGPVAGDDSFVMTGSAVTTFITGAYNKGIRDFDIDLAYDAMLDAHSIGGLFDKGPYQYASWSGDGGANRPYLDTGFVPHNLNGSWKSRGAGETVEYSFQDWSLGQLAKALGKVGINAAQLAAVEVSSQVNATDYAGVRAVDGRPIRSGVLTTNNVEWRSTESTPWIKLTWRTARRISKVVLSDRRDSTANVNSGVLTFSDGTTVNVTSIPTDGTNRVVTFTSRLVTSVRFDATGGTGTNVGLNEIEAWDDTDVGAYLIERSGSWRNLFDRSTGFVRPRGSDGRWQAPFNPLDTGDWVEANAWQGTFYCPHDVTGLANRLGGRDAYATKLNSAFELAEPVNFIGGGQNGDENAYVNYGNQPALHMGHLFNYVGKPWLTQYWVRKVKEKVYSAVTTTDGYGHHDEDQGQMGSLSALMAIGLFEVTGASLPQPVYDITSPIFDKITITLNPDYYDGETFTITTVNNSATNMYIQSAKLNGTTLNNAWFNHSTLAAGGTLELTMGATAKQTWGVTQLPPSRSPLAPAVMEVTADQVRIGPGQQATVTVGAKNLTGSAITVNWQANTPLGLQATPASGTLTVAANATATATVTLQAATDLPQSLHRVRFTGTSGGTELPDAVLYAHGVPLVSLAPAPGQLRLLQATATTFRVGVTNNDSVARDVVVTPQVPAGWTVSPTNRTLSAVAVGGTVDTTFAVTPSATATGWHSVTLNASGTWGAASQRVVATVGRKVALVGGIDLATTGFALAPSSYSSYPATFPNDVSFTVGTSNAATAWSYIHPGPDDLWAGSKAHTFTLRFDLPSAPTADLALTAWLVDSHPTGPGTLDFALNGGTATTVQLPAGGGDGYRWDGATGTIRPTLIDFVLPAGQLRSGQNTVTITKPTGSWHVYDAVAVHETIPAISLAVSPNQQLRLLQATPNTFQVRLTNNDAVTRDTDLRLQVPSGWTVTPANRAIQVSAGATVTTTFTVTPSATATGSHNLTLTSQGAWGTGTRQVAAAVSRRISLVGATDLATTGFALAPTGHSSYPTTFPSDVDFTIGTSNAATAWSYIHPGPNDIWAGSKNHTFTVRFNLTQLPTTSLAFTAWLVDTHPTAPGTVALALNGGTATTVQLSAGGGDGYRWTGGTGVIRPSSFDFVLPVSGLRVGQNTVTITKQAGSWHVYDAIAIRETP
ncbi:MAG TPA: glycoside hydrolase domain-containing protein [Actinokineospora sp.]|nr:glycoside hydrolase domain-containing protein [Actinokineospora sp.]